MHWWCVSLAPNHRNVHAFCWTCTWSANNSHIPGSVSKFLLGYTFLWDPNPGYNYSAAAKCADQFVVFSCWIISSSTAPEVRWDKHMLFNQYSNSQYQNKTVIPRPLFSLTKCNFHDENNLEHTKKWSFCQYYFLNAYSFVEMNVLSSALVHTYDIEW